MKQKLKVVLSIKPKFANKIFEGSKQFEFRKKIWKNTEVNKIIVYASTPIQKVIGEFEINKIHHEDLKTLWKITREQAGITQKYFDDYFYNKGKGYAIQIKNPIRYKEPKKLIDWGIKTAPQSFIYLKPKQLNLF